MKKIIFILGLMLITQVCYAGQFVFTYDDGSAQRIIAGIERHYPLPLNADGSPKYTHAQWAKEVMRNFVLGLVQSSEEEIERNKISVTVNPDLLR